MNANDLYKALPIDGAYNNQVGNGWCLGEHLREIPDLEFSDVKLEKIRVKTIFNHHFDGERCCTLKTIWYEEKPVMIVQNGGRGGRDHKERFVTDKELFMEMCNYILTMVMDLEEVSVIDSNEENKELYCFYNCEIEPSDLKFE